MKGTKTTWQAPRLLLALALLMMAPACSQDPDDEVPAEPLRVALTLNGSNARDSTFEFVCQGSPRLLLDIQGGRGPYEVLVSTTRLSGQGTVSTPVGSLGAADTVTLLRSLEGQGSFTLEHPAIRFADAGRGALTAGLRFAVLVRDSESSVSFREAVPGQTLPGSLLGAVDGVHLVQAATTDVVTSLCSQ